jgi:hypothetical protein
VQTGLVFLKKLYDVANNTTESTIAGELEDDYDEDESGRKYIILENSTVGIQESNN